MKLGTHLRGIVAAASVTSVMALAACGGGTDSSSASSPIATGGKITGTVRFVGSEDANVYQPLISKFEATNPGITVKYTEVPFAQYTSVLQQRLSSKDSSLDVFTVDQPVVASLAARGYLQDLDQIGSAVKKAALPTQYDVNVYNGSLYAAPLSTSGQYLFYNTDLLKKAGVTPPPSDPTKAWTWEQTLAAAKKTQSAGSTWGLILEQIGLYYQLQPLPESLGGGSGLGGKNNLTPQISNSQWVKAMSWYHDLFAQGVSPRGVDSYSTFPLFSSGKDAFFVGGPWDIAQAAATKDLNWGMAPMPYFAGGKRVTPNGGWSLGINPASGAKPAALKFLEFASTDPDGNILFAANEANLPANQEAFDKYLPQLSKLGGSRSADAAAITQYDAAHTAVARPVSVGYPQFENLMNKAFSDIINGTSAKSALDDASQKITETLRQYQ